MESHKALTNIAQSIANEEGRELIEETALVRFREDPVGFIRAVYPDAELGEHHVQALEMMAGDPNTRILLRARGGGLNYVIELVKDIPRELDALLNSDPGLVHSWSMVHKSTTEIIEDIARARDSIFASRKLRPVDVLDPEEWTYAAPENSGRQAFKHIAGGSSWGRSSSRKARRKR